MTAVGANWAGNIAYGAGRIHEPTSVDELAETVARARVIRALGTRHSFSDVADTDGDLVSLRSLPRVFEPDADARTVTIDGGTTYSELCEPLHEAGLALPNLASLPHVSVAGACATATHGSGNTLGNLATAVRALDLVCADGTVRRLARGDASFDGAVVSLGLAGVVVRLVLDVEQAYEMRQDVLCDVPFAEAVARLDTITAAADSVSLFTTWRTPEIEQVWLKSRELDAAPAIPGATAASTELHPIGALSPEACTPQQGVPGPWFERLPHFRVDRTPSAGDELQSEYLLPRSAMAEALARLDAVRERFAELVLVSEIRSVAADGLWLSTSYGRDSGAIHFTWVNDWPAVRAVLSEVEAALAPFEPRPHWGKLFTTPVSRLGPRYPRFDDFRALCDELDPTGKFRGSFGRRLLDPAESG